MSHQLSGQLSPLSHLNPVLSFRRPIAYTRNVFTPNQDLNLEKNKNITGFMSVSNKDCNYYYFF